LAEVIAPDRAELDLSDSLAVRARIKVVKPDWIVNAAAYTAVDRAETEPAVAQLINGEAPGLLAEEAAKLGAALIHYSTDYVFDGKATRPYREEDSAFPLSVYGASKLDGESRIRKSGARFWILRTSWVYSARGRNFLRTMLDLANRQDELRVVADQVGAPTWCRWLAEATGQMMAIQSFRGTFESGIYHVAAGGETSWHGFANHIVKEGGARRLCKTLPVRGITTDQYPTPACRPAYSLLSGNKLARDFGLRLPDWKLGLTLCLDELAPTGAA
jgi:dTDP-4-dehydrorhamnose reductase